MPYMVMALDADNRGKYDAVPKLFPTTEAAKAYAGLYAPIRKPIVVYVPSKEEKTNQRTP